ncbi:Flp family type IVb pilin [Ruegeria profundi]|uniref:Flp family type IVb pilin n=1 Tax=Ruegeria profundi TaxID=1685378 RepID=UPI003C7B1CC5
MIKFIKNFRKDEDGAVTVDWVVLTAAVIGLGTVAYTQISGGAVGLATDVNTALSGATISTGTNNGTAGGITGEGTNGGS